MLERFKITGLCILAAVVYGIIHDQITARVCLEYFTVFHPPIFHDTHNPTLLGLGWGVLATWWVGFFLGVPLGLCATVGGLPKMTARQLVRPVAVVLAILGMLALVCGVGGWWMASTGRYRLPEIDAQFLPPEHVSAFVGDAAAHLASYGFGTVLGIGLCAWVLVKRWRRRRWAAL